jgi:hypothetical protein
MYTHGTGRRCELHMPTVLDQKISYRRLQKFQLSTLFIHWQYTKSWQVYETLIQATGTDYLEFSPILP